MTQALYDRIPELLDHMVTCSMSQACKRVGISRQSWWAWMVASAKGDPRFQAIEWNSITAPLHIQYNNARALTAMEIERSAMENASQGFEQDVFFQGVRMFEKVLKPEYQEHADDLEMLELIVGPDWESICYKMAPAKQRLKPSDALVIRMLEAHHPKRYGSKHTVDVKFGGVLRLDKPAQATTIEATPVEFEEIDTDEDTEQRGGYLALATPAKTSQEFEARAAAGEFDHAPVEVEAADGSVTTITPEERKPDPLRRHPRAYMADTGERPPQPAPKYSTSRGSEGKDGIGHGPDPHRLGKHVGFDVSQGPPMGGRRGVLR